MSSLLEETCQYLTNTRWKLLFVVLLLEPDNSQKSNRYNLKIENLKIAYELWNKKLLRLFCRIDF